MTFKSVDDMPESVRRAYLDQYAKETQKRNPLVNILGNEEVPTTISNIPAMTFTPYGAMNVGADETILAGLNRTEKRYYEILKSRPQYVWIGVKPQKFRLAGHTTYEPDFATLDKDGIFTLIDTKGGHVWVKSQLKMKMAARIFPFFRWIKAVLILESKKRPESLKETVFPS